MHVRGAFTSNLVYDAKNLPRDFLFPRRAGQPADLLYDYIPLPPPGPVPRDRPEEILFPQQESTLGTPNRSLSTLHDSSNVAAEVGSGGGGSS